MWRKYGITIAAGVILTVLWMVLVATSGEGWMGAVYALLGIAGLLMFGLIIGGIMWIIDRFNL